MATTRVIGSASKKGKGKKMAGKVPRKSSRRKGQKTVPGAGRIGAIRKKRRFRPGSKLSILFINLYTNLNSCGSS